MAVGFRIAVERVSWRRFRPEVGHDVLEPAFVTALARPIAVVPTVANGDWSWIAVVVSKTAVVAPPFAVRIVAARDHVVVSAPQRVVGEVGAAVGAALEAVAVSAAVGGVMVLVEIMFAQKVCLFSPPSTNAIQTLASPNQTLGDVVIATGYASPICLETKLTGFFTANDRLLYAAVFPHAHISTKLAARRFHLRPG